VGWKNIQEPRYKLVHLNRAMPHRPVHPLSLGQHGAVIQYRHCWCTLLPELPLLLPAPQSSASGQSHSPSAMPCMVAPSSLVQPPTLRKSLPMTCLLTSRLSNPVAPSIWLSEVPPPPSEHTFSVAMEPGTLPGHSWKSSWPTAWTSAAYGVRSANSQLHIYIRIAGMEPR